MTTEAVTAGAAATAGSQAVIDLRPAAVVVLDDRTVDEGLSDLRWHLRSLVLGGVRTIEVDLSQTSRMRSTALAALLSAHRACRARGGGVVLVNPNRQVADVVRRTGLSRVFRIQHAGRTAAEEVRR